MSLAKHTLDQCMCFLFIFHVRIHNNALQCLTLYRSLSSSSQIHGNTFSYFGVCIFVKLRQYIAIYWRHRCLNRRQCNLLAEAQNRKYGATPLNNLRQKHLRTKNDCQHHSPDRNFKIIKVIRMRIVMMMMMLMMIIMMMMKKSLGGSQKCQERT